MESLTLSEDHEIRLESARDRECPTLRQSRPEQLLAPFVIEKQGGVSIPLERPFSTALHPPLLAAPDDENSQPSTAPFARSTFITDRSVPESRVLGHDTRCRVGSERESACAIAKPALQHVHADKS